MELSTWLDEHSIKKEQKKNHPRTPEAQAWNGNSVNSATLNWPKQFPRSASRTKKYSPPLEGRCCTVTLKRGMDTGRSTLGPFLQKPTGCCVAEWQTKCHSVRNEAFIVCIILDITYITAVNITFFLMILAFLTLEECL